MTLVSVYGRAVNKPVNRYRIEWEATSPSMLQLRAKKLLYPIWRTDIVFEEFPVYGTKLRVDFLNMTKRIAVEVNGPQHDKFNKFFHNNSRLNFLAGIKRDMTKSKWLESNKIKLIEVIEADLKDEAVFYKLIKD